MSARSLLVKALPCFACIQQRVKQATPTEEHHLLSGNKRRGDEYSVPLCAWHHRGEPPAGFGATSMAYVAGPSLARSSKKFRATFGTDEELLTETNRRLQLAEAM